MQNKIIGILISALLFTAYFAYNCWQDEQQAEQEVINLTKSIKVKEAELERQYQISLKVELEKQQLENDSLKYQQELKYALQNNTCANEFIPNDITNRLHQRANSLR